MFSPRGARVTSVFFMLFVLGGGLAALRSLAAPPSQEKDQTTFKVAVNLVIVNASVTGPDGRPVTDLQAGDFSITEDLRKQEIALFEPTTSPFHVVLLIDVSASTASKLELIRNAAVRFFERLSPADRIAIVEVGSSVELVEGFTADRARLAAAVRGLGRTPARLTRLYDSIIYALDELLSGVKDRKALVLLTDGGDNGSLANEHRMNVAVYRNDAVLYSLLVDTAPDQVRLLKENLQRLSQLSLILCASGSSFADPVKRGARLLVERMPRSSRISLYECPCAWTLVKILTSELSKEKTYSAIQQSRPFCEGEIKVRYARDLPASGDVVVVVTDSEGFCRSRLPSGAWWNAEVLQVRGRSDQEILAELPSLLRDLPPDADEVVRTLPDSYRSRREILARAAETTGGASFALAELGEVDRYYAQIAAELRTIYSLGYYSSEASPLFRTVRVKVRRPGCAVRARQAYLPK
jgi:hypothetical protein